MNSENGPFFWLTNRENPLIIYTSTSENPPFQPWSKSKSPSKKLLQIDWQAKHLSKSALNPERLQKKPSLTFSKGAGFPAQRSRRTPNPPSDNHDRKTKSRDNKNTGWSFCHSLKTGNNLRGRKKYEASVSLDQFYFYMKSSFRLHEAIDLISSGKSALSAAVRASIINEGEAKKWKLCSPSSCPGLFFQVAIRVPSLNLLNKPIIRENP